MSRNINTLVAGTFKAFAEVLGRHRVTVSSWISRGSAKRSWERSFEQQVEDLDSRIARWQL